MIEPSIAICCLSASTWRPLFYTLREKSSGASGYAPQTGGSNNRYFMSRSNEQSHSQSNNFRLSRNHTGYTKREDGDDKETGSYDDAIALRTLATGPGIIGGSRRMSEGDDDTKGILTNTTVEIMRHDR